MSGPPEQPIMQEILWGPKVGGALWPFQPLGWTYQRPLHLHCQPEVLIMRRGSLRLVLGGESFTLRAGQFAWIAPSVQHVTEALTEDVDFWVLQLEPWLVRRAVEQMQRGRAIDGCARDPWLGALLGIIPDPPVVEPTSRHRDAIEQAAVLAYQTYLDAWRGLSAPNRNYEWIPPWTTAGEQQARERLTRVWLMAVAATREEYGRTPPRRIARRAFDAILKDPLMSRSALCRELGVSEGHLSRRFPELFGSSLVGQRARARLMTFVTLARSSHHGNMMSLCLEAGFGSYAQLHRVFMAHSTTSPREYLRGEGQLSAAKIIRRL